MTAERLVVHALPSGLGAPPNKYLCAMVAVAKSARRGEYVVVHFGSGTFYRTDELGAVAVRALIDGRSDTEVIELVERIEAGSGERGRRLIDRLDSKGAMALAPGSQSAGRSLLRRPAALAMGKAMSILAPLVRVTPVPVLAWLFRILPATPTAHHVWRSNRFTILNNLRGNGSAGPKRPTPQRNYLFMYLGTVLTSDQLGRLVDRLFDRNSANELAGRLRSAGPTVGAFLHSPLCVAVPNVLRARGHEVVRVVIPCANGINLRQGSGPLREFFGESREMTVEISDTKTALADVSGALLRHLRAGRSVHVALDIPARVQKPVAEIEMLGHCFPRNDWPAWLAVRSGRPLALWTTHGSPTGVVIAASPLLHADPSLPVERRVADLSERLYGYAEAAIREHPEAWTFMSHLSILTVSRR